MHIHKRGMTIPNPDGTAHRSENLIIAGDDGVTISLNFDNAMGRLEHLSRCDILVWDKDGKDLEVVRGATIVDLAKAISKYTGAET